VKATVRTFLYAHRWFWPIILLALVLRLGRLDLMQYDIIDGNACILAYQLVRAGQFHLFGLVTSLDIRNPPFFIWLLSLPMLLSREPVFLASFIGLLGVAAVALTYITGRRFYSPRVGLLAALTMAISPCVIFYSRRLFAQDVMPLLSAIVLFALLEYHRGGKSWALCLALLVAMLSAGVHFSGFALCLSLAAAWLLVRPKLKWQPAALALALALLAYSPYLLRQFRTDFQDIGKIAKAIVSGDNKEAFSKLKIFRYSFNLASHGNMEYILGSEPYLADNPRDNPYTSFMRYLPGYRALATLAGLGILITALCAPWFAWRRRKANQKEEGDDRANDDRNFWRTVLPLTAWLLVPPIVYASMKLTVIPSYLLVIFPAPFLLLGLGFDRLLSIRRSQDERQGRGLLGGVMFGLLGLWCTHQLAFVIAFVVILIKPGLKLDYPYVPYRDQRQAVELIHELSEGRSWSVRINFADERIIPFHYFYLSYLVGGADGHINSAQRISDQPEFKFILFDIPAFRSSSFIGAINEMEGAAHYACGAVQVAELSHVDPVEVLAFETTWKTNPALAQRGK
jgi:4-amino-4-deoxy-L-arabinose transferase-like glycosyltransferase